MESSSSLNSDESTSETKSIGKDLEKSKETKLSYSDIMMQRWQKHIEKTTVDDKDLSDCLSKLNIDNG